jgi:hypothetical protein
MHGEGEKGERQLLATGRINSYNHPKFLIEQPWACKDTLDAMYAVVLRCEGSESAEVQGPRLPTSVLGSAGTQAHPCNDAPTSAHVLRALRAIAH